MIYIFYLYVFILDEMHWAIKYLQGQWLPFDICAELEAWTHDLAPVMKELREKHPPLIPQLVIRARRINHVRRLSFRYKHSLESIAYDASDPYKFRLEIGRTDSMEKSRMYRYLRKPKLQRHSWQ